MEFTSTKIGKIHLNHCLMNASGVKCKTEIDLSNIYKTKVRTGAVVSKSCTLDFRRGNEGTTYYHSKETEMSINSSGLPNLGYEFYIEMAKKLEQNSRDRKFRYLYEVKKPYIMSVSGMSQADNIHILNGIFDKHKSHSIDGVELNLSCPNIIGKPQIGYDFEAFDEILRKTFELDVPKSINMGLKLPPYFDISHYSQAFDIINKYPIDTLTCINSIGNGLVVDPINECSVISPKKGLGGIGGSPIKSVALANVFQFSKNTHCDVIGCGGIVSAMDVFEHILCGAKAVQLGTIVMLEGLDVFKKIERELLSIMRNKGYKKISDFCGKLKYVEPDFNKY